MQRNILICTNHLKDLAGSEIVTLELAEWFAGESWNIDIFTTVFDEPMSNFFVQNIDPGQLNIFTDSNHEFLQGNYDLIWINHSLIPQSILSEWELQGVATPTIWHHMSAFEPLELPFFPSLELDFAWKITSVSKEIENRLVDFGIEPNSVTLFENPAPKEFNTVPLKHKNELTKLLVVSNHPPLEVSKSIEILSDHGIETKIWGIGGETYQRLNANALKEFDAVITIGKTVQYCLSMGIPVYNYDHFGGNGWLSDVNYQTEASWNFSGRSSYRKLSPEKIADEVISGFSLAVDWAKKNKETLAERYSLDRQLKELISGFESYAPRIHANKVAFHQALVINQVRWRLINSTDHFQKVSVGAKKQASEAEMRASEAEMRASEAEMRASEAEMRASEAELLVAEFQTSSSWKLTRPLRRVRDVFKRQKL